MFRITRNNILANSNPLHLLSRSLIFLLNLHKDIVDLIVDQETTLLPQTWKIDREAKKRWNQRSVKYTVLLRCIKWQFANDAGKETIWKTYIIDLSIYFHEREGRIVLRKKKTRKQRGILQWRIKQQFPNDANGNNFDGGKSSATFVIEHKWHRYSTVLCVRTSQSMGRAHQLAAG